MAISDIPVLSMLRTRLHWGQERQRLLAENVANADTPNFRARDLKAPKFAEPSQINAEPVSGVVLARTDEGHFVGVGLSGSTFRTTADKYEIQPTGTSVNLEEEMMKIAGNQMEYQAATALYTRSLGLLKTAVGKR